MSKPSRPDTTANHGDKTPARTRAGSLTTLAIAWAAVLVPLAWGIVMTLGKARTLFHPS
ncbi:MAG: hypothetical protein FWD17_10495 [Polyangiaceae bacterium]|nr:hypothetical protein [Polyangiaceae bacterium]